MDERANLYQAAIREERATQEQDYQTRKSAEGKLAGYRAALQEVAGSPPREEASWAEDWADAFLALQPAMAFYNADFLLDYELERMDDSNADPCRSLAFLIFYWAATGQRDDIVQQLTAARREGYEEPLRANLHAAGDFLRERVLIDREPPWTYVYSTQQALARDLQGLKGYSLQNLPRMLNDDPPRLEQRPAIGGKRYRATRDEQQREILKKIRKTRGQDS